MRLNLEKAFDAFARQHAGEFISNPGDFDEEDALVLLGEFACELEVRARQNDETLEDIVDEKDWIMLWRKLGVDEMDAADMIAGSVTRVTD